MEIQLQRIMASPHFSIYIFTIFLTISPPVIEDWYRKCLAASNLHSLAEFSTEFNESNVSQNVFVLFMLVKFHHQNASYRSLSLVHNNLFAYFLLNVQIFVLIEWFQLFLVQRLEIKLYTFQLLATAFSIIIVENHRKMWTHEFIRFVYCHSRPSAFSWTEIRVILWWISCPKIGKRRKALTSSLVWMQLMFNQLIDLNDQ